MIRRPNFWRAALVQSNDGSAAYWASGVGLTLPVQKVPGRQQLRAMDFPEPGRAQHEMAMKGCVEGFENVLICKSWAGAMPPWVPAGKSSSVSNTNHDRVGALR